MASDRGPFGHFLSWVVCAILVACAATESALAAGLVSFQATPIKGPECVTDTTGYFYAEDELNPDPATAMPPG